MKRSIAALAAHNNAQWCDAVCRAHDRPGEFHDTLWLTRLGAPRFYPDAVTLADVEAAPALMEAIAALVGSTPQREWAVKDSFKSLDLRSLGFEPLFDAEWVALSALPRAAHPSEYRWTRVTSKAGLIAWEQSWGGEEVNAAALSKPACSSRFCWWTPTSFSSPFKETMGLLAAVSSIEVPRLSAFQISSVTQSIWSTADWRR